MGPKRVEYNLHIKMDGTAIHEVTHREEGADCRVITKHASALGAVISDETTGPFCDKQNERA